MTHYVGTLRITNLSTLRKWISNGKMEMQYSLGWRYYPGCGRFRTDECTCHKCRNGGAKRREIIEQFEKQLL